MSEAEYLDTIYPYTEEYIDETKRLEINFMKQLYKDNSKAKVGTIVECPYCHKRFYKKTYQQKFHSTKCKDKYWNIVNPRGIYGR